MGGLSAAAESLGPVKKKGKRFSTKFKAFETHTHTSGGLTSRLNSAAHYPTVLKYDTLVHH